MTSYRPPQANGNGDPEPGEQPGQGTTFDVRVWAVKKIPSRRSGAKKNAATYRVRWVVAGRIFSANFTTTALAESERAALMSAARRGEAFDVETGQPLSAVSQQVRSDHPWWNWAQTYVDLKWSTLAPNSRLSLAEALTTVTMALLPPGNDRPTSVDLRRAMMRWAFVTPRRKAGGPPSELARAVAWLARCSPDVSALADPVTLRSVLDSLASKLDGTPAAPTTIARKRAVLFNALDLAVERGLLDTNPLLRIRWTPPKAAVTIDPACVVNPDQARSLLVAVAKVGDGTCELPVPKTRRGVKAPFTVRRKEPQGGPLVAFFGCLYYAGMRPSEALALVDTDLDLPDDDTSWGLLRIARNDPEVTTMWTDTGRREPRQLKHRAIGEVRPVPCCPDLVALLRRHLAMYGTAPDGRLFRGVRGGMVKESVYTEVWQGARVRAFTARQIASQLAARPYDLRHSCVSAWLAAGVDPAQIAEWVGHSVAVLHRVYAHVLPGRDEIAKKRIEELLKPDSRIEQGPSTR